MANRRQDIDTFQAVTGADSDVAERVLSAHKWDLDRAVNFFMENGTDGMAALQAAAPSHPAAQDVYDIDDTELPDRSARHTPVMLDDDDDPELQEVLAASRGTQNGARGVLHLLQVSAFLRCHDLSLSVRTVRLLAGGLSASSSRPPPDNSSHPIELEASSLPFFEPPPHRAHANEHLRTSTCRSHAELYST